VGNTVGAFDGTMIVFGANVGVNEGLNVVGARLGAAVAGISPYTTYDNPVFEFQFGAPNITSYNPSLFKSPPTPQYDISMFVLAPVIVNPMLEVNALICKLFDVPLCPYST
jgi:hypothetical protein